MDDLQELERSLTSVQNKRPGAPTRHDMAQRNLPHDLDDGGQSDDLLRPGKRIGSSQSATNQDASYQDDYQDNYQASSQERNDRASDVPQPTRPQKPRAQTPKSQTTEKGQSSVLKSSLQAPLLAASAGGINYFLLLIMLLGTLLIGAGVWYAYNQGVLKGSEAAAPTLQATGPIKSAPDAPGGLPIPDPVPQIYSQLDGQLDGQEDPDQIEALLPAPEDPMRPLLGTLERQGERAPAGDAGELSSPDLPSIVNPPPLSPDDIAVEAERIDQTRVPAAFGSQLEPEAITDPQPAAPDNAAVSQNGAAPQPDDSLPAPRVAPEAQQQQQVAQQQASLSPVPQNPTPQNPALQNPVGGPNPWRIQLAALKSQQEAESFWRAQQALHPDLLQRLTLGIEPVQVNGKPYFRVRVGPLPDEGAAINLCANIRARGQDCFLIRP